MQVTLPTLIDLFATTKQIEGKSERTITWYRMKERLKAIRAARSFDCTRALQPKVAARLDRARLVLAVNDQDFSSFS